MELGHEVDDDLKMKAANHNPRRAQGAKTIQLRVATIPLVVHRSVRRI